MTATTSRLRRRLPVPGRALARAAAAACILNALGAPAGADGTTRPDLDGSDQVGNFEVSPHALYGDRAGPVTFSVIGDAPYSEAEVPVFLQQLADHNRYSRARFVAHVGDIFSGSSPCTEDRYRQTAGWLRSLHVPVFIVPGDNEWVDCTDQEQAWTFWNAHLLGLERGFLCGVPPVQRQGVRPENFAFVMSGVLFLGVNVVSGAPLETMLESADWVEEQLMSHRGLVRAAVVLSQAGPSPARSSFFTPFVLHAAAFAAPVLLVHGDGHSWQYESPYGAANVTRVQIERTKSPPVHITVTRGSASPFAFERDPWPPGTPEIDDAPCVDAGPDRTLALGTTTLLGAATDDGLAGPPVVTWSQLSGPGAIGFTSPGSAITTASFAQLGTHVLQLEVFDGFYTQRDSLTVVAADPATVPAVQADAGLGQEDIHLVVPAPGVLGNDSHGSGLSLEAALLVPPAHGSLTLAPDGGYTYRPDPNWFGGDTFYYEAADGNGATGVGLVTVQVLAVNDAPVALPESYTTLVGDPLVVTAPGILANDSDVDGDLLTVVLANDVAHGTLVLGPGGSFTYTPEVDFIGVDSFTYELTDGMASSFATVTLSVSPVSLKMGPAADAYVDSGNPDENYGWEGVLRLEQDRNTDASYLKFDVSGTGVSVRRARLRLFASHGGPDGGQVYLVSNDYEGTQTAWLEDGITWANAPAMSGSPLASVGSVSSNSWVEWDVTAAVTGDGTYSFGLQNSATQFVEYSSKEGPKPPELLVETDLPNQPPVAVNDSYATPEDSVLAVPVPGVLANDSDDPRDVLSVVLLLAPASGTLDLAADGSFTYTPMADFHGSVGFVYQVQDGRGGTASAGVTLVVTPENDAPVAADDTYSAAEDSVLVVDAPGLLGNDTDVDGQPLAAAVYAGPSHGELVLGADGSFSYTPAPDFHGPDSFQYIVEDGAGGSDLGTVSLTVDGRPDLPIGNDDAFTTDEGAPIVVPAPGVLGNDSDADGDSLTATLLSAPAQGTLVLDADGSFTYTPPSAFHGGDSFSYTVADGMGGSDTASVTLTVTAVNDAPVAVDDEYGTNEDVPLQVATPGVLGNDGDPDGDVLTAVVATGPANGTLLLNADGSFTYTPAADFNGSDSFVYAVADSAGAADSASVSLTVVALNDAPVAVADSLTTDEDVPLVVGAPGVLGNDSDTDGDSLVVALATPPSQGILIFAADGGFTYTPAGDFNGGDTLTYVAHDGNGGSDTTTVVLTVTPVPDSPVAAADSYGVEVDSTLVIPAPGVLGNDSDADGDSLSAALSVAPLHGSANLQPDGGFDYTPASAFAGADSFAYGVSDVSGGSDTGWVRIDVGGGAATAAADTTSAAAVALEPEPSLSLGAELLRVRPNPFNGTVVIEYQVEKTLPVEVSIFDVRGKRVHRLVRDSQEPGVHRAVWNGRSGAGNPVPSGVYFLRVHLGPRVLTTRLVLLE